MGINYLQEAEKYRPLIIRRLLVGEAPPASGKTYFYVPKIMSNNQPIENDCSLPATIFNHYFKRRPSTIDQYISFLRLLQEMGIFLIDICDSPIKVCNSPEGKHKIINNIQKLRNKIKARCIEVSDTEISFLLARGGYITHIKQEFPDSHYFRWKEFRVMSK